MRTGVDAARALQGDLADLRRRLHREPELGLELPRTQEKVLEALGGLPLEMTLGKDLSSVTAVLRGGRPGGAVLLRADMDALPIQECSGEEFTSRFDGLMHACGHDLHTAGLVGAAILLADRRESLCGDVVFMFQPGEEGCNGAALMIEEGVLDAAGKPLNAAYSLHVLSNLLPRRSIATRPGPVLAASDSFHVTVIGRGGHGSTPHTARDPVPAICEIVLALQTYVTRMFDIFDPVVVTVGSLHAGTMENVIPDSAEFRATVRSYSPGNQARLAAELPRLATNIAHAHGLDLRADYRPMYPVTVNDPGETRFALDTATELFGHAVLMPQPLAGSEDFSLVLRQVPGTMLLIGATPDGLDPAEAPMNHAPRARFDDSVLHLQSELLAELAFARLARTAGSGGRGEVIDDVQQIGIDPVGDAGRLGGGRDQVGDQ
ncbi:M20 metallopeptidase family protein [Nocardia concava]|uniref:M20 metallopeptidase family protein n=1 Tax=Nocardia concava TaxID=257281 RepID=UPI000300822A|nr:M20 family metallopeptidase [Nocardia concava]